MRQIGVVAIILTLLTTSSCKHSSAQGEFSDEKAKEMLMRFYANYIKVNAILTREKFDSIDNRFYASYLKMHSGMKIDSPDMERSYRKFNKENAVSQRKKSDSIVRKYCTDKMVNYINKLFSGPPRPEVNGDVFLRGNMIEATMLEGLSVQTDSKKKGQFYIKYGTGSGAPVTIKLSVVKEKDAYKIDHVFYTEGVDELNR